MCYRTNEYAATHLTYGNILLHCLRLDKALTCQKTYCSIQGLLHTSHVCTSKHLLVLQICVVCRSQWPRGLRRRSSVTRLLRLWVRIPPGAWMFFCCECCVLSGRGLCDGLITRPGKSYRLWRVVMCDQETSKTRRLKPATGL